MISINRDSVDSRMIEWIRFPMIVLIVLIHTRFTNNQDDFAYYLGTILSEMLPYIAVPLFFFISGYLFFAKYEHFGQKEYFIMLKKKSKTLLLPYILWNAIGYYVYGFFIHFTDKIHPWELYKIFYATDNTIIETSLFGYKFVSLSTPYVGPLWFIRDLMIMMIISPIIWFVIRKLKMWSILFFIMIYYLKLGVPIVGFGLASLCFFSLGATFSINGKSLSKICGTIKTPILVSYLILFAFCSWMNIINHSSIYIYTLKTLMLFLGIISLLMIACRCVKRRECSKIRSLGETSFFIYAFHTLFIFYSTQHLTDIIDKLPIIGCTISYILLFSIRLFVSLFFFYALRKYCPRALSILVGGRIRKTNEN